MTKFCAFWSRVPPTGPQHCRVTDILLNSILFSRTESDNTQSTPSGFGNIHQNNKKTVLWIDDGDDFDKQDGWSYCCVFNNIVLVLIFEAMITISKALSDVIGVCKGKRWWQIDRWLKDVPQTPLSQANNAPRYLDIKKQDYPMMNVAPVIKQSS